MGDTGEAATKKEEEVKVEEEPNLVPKEEKVEDDVKASQDVTKVIIPFKKATQT